MRFAHDTQTTDTYILAPTKLYTPIDLWEWWTRQATIEMWDIQSICVGNPCIFESDGIAPPKGFLGVIPRFVVRRNNNMITSAVSLKPGRVFKKAGCAAKNFVSIAIVLHTDSMFIKVCFKHYII